LNINQDWPTWGFYRRARPPKPLIFDNKYDISNVPSSSAASTAADDRRLISQLLRDPPDVAPPTFSSVRGDQRPGSALGRRQQPPSPIIRADHRRRTGKRQRRILGGPPAPGGQAAWSSPSTARPTNPLLGGPWTSRRATLPGRLARVVHFLQRPSRRNPSSRARGDVYNLSKPAARHPPRTRPSPRGFVTGGADISYPLIKQAGDITYVLEPLAQIAILRPTPPSTPRIPNLRQPGSGSWTRPTCSRSTRSPRLRPL